MGLMSADVWCMVMVAAVLQKLVPIFSISRRMLQGLRFWKPPPAEALERLLPRHKVRKTRIVTSVNGVPRARLRQLPRDIHVLMDSYSGLLEHIPEAGRRANPLSSLAMFYEFDAIIFLTTVLFVSYCFADVWSCVRGPAPTNMHVWMIALSVGMVCTQLVQTLRGLGRGSRDVQLSLWAAAASFFLALGLSWLPPYALDFHFDAALALTSVRIQTLMASLGLQMPALRAASSLRLVLAMGCSAWALVVTRPAMRCAQTYYTLITPGSPNWSAASVGELLAPDLFPDGSVTAGDAADDGGPAGLRAVGLRLSAADGAADGAAGKAVASGEAAKEVASGSGSAAGAGEEESPPSAAKLAQQQADLDNALRGQRLSPARLFCLHLAFWAPLLVLLCWVPPLTTSLVLPPQPQIRDLAALVASGAAAASGDNATTAIALAAGASAANLALATSADEVAAAAAAAAWGLWRSGRALAAVALGCLQLATLRTHMQAFLGMARSPAVVAATQNALLRWRAQHGSAQRATGLSAALLAAPQSQLSGMSSYTCVAALMYSGPCLCVAMVALALRRAGGHATGLCAAAQDAMRGAAGVELPMDPTLGAKALEETREFRRKLLGAVTGRDASAADTSLLAPPEELWESTLGFLLFWMVLSWFLISAAALSYFSSQESGGCIHAIRQRRRKSESAKEAAATAEAAKQRATKAAAKAAFKGPAKKRKKAKKAKTAKAAKVD